MQDHLFVSDLMALRKRRANVGRALRSVRDRDGRIWRNERLGDQYVRTFFALTVIELRLTDKVAP